MMETNERLTGEAVSRGFIAPYLKGKHIFQSKQGVGLASYI